MFVFIEYDDAGLRVSGSIYMYLRGIFQEYLKIKLRLTLRVFRSVLSLCNWFLMTADNTKVKSTMSTKLLAEFKVCVPRCYLDSGCIVLVTIVLCFHLLISKCVILLAAYRPC